MNRFTYVLSALFLVGSMSAPAAVMHRTDNHTTLKAVAVVKADEAPSEDLQPVYDAPEGVHTIYSRNCDGFNVEGFEASHGPVLGSIVEAVTTSDNTIWLSYIASEYPTDAWVKTTRNGDILSIEGPQAIAYDYNDRTYEEVTVYLVPLKLVVDENQQGTYVEADELRYDFKINSDGTLMSVDPQMLLGVCTYGQTHYEGQEPFTGYIWSGYGDRNITMTPVTEEALTPPAGLEYEKWTWQDPLERARVNVCIDGTDFYISGMDRTLPDAWIKGSIQDDKVVFPSGQYLGPDFAIHYMSYFCGAEISYSLDVTTGNKVMRIALTDAAVFDYDRDRKSLKLNDGYAINSTPSTLYPLYGYENVEITYQKHQDNAIPATPYDLVFSESFGSYSLWFQLPPTDIDGVLLDTSGLYYEAIVNGEVFEFKTSTYFDFPENMTLIPYDFSDWNDVWVSGPDHTVYFYEEPESIGIRSVYIEDGKRLYSAIAYAPGYEDTAIDDVSIDRQVTSVEWYDLSGRLLNSPSNIIAIRSITYDDGSTVREKVILK